MYQLAVDSSTLQQAREECETRSARLRATVKFEATGAKVFPRKPHGRFSAKRDDAATKRSAGSKSVLRNMMLNLDELGNASTYDRSKDFFWVHNQTQETLWTQEEAAKGQFLLLVIHNRTPLSSALIHELFRHPICSFSFSNCCGNFSIAAACHATTSLCWYQPHSVEQSTSCNRSRRCTLNCRGDCKDRWRS